MLEFLADESRVACDGMFTDKVPEKFEAETIGEGKWVNAKV